jgi:hypothetical protein
MRVDEWADEVWVSTITPAALGFRMDIMSSSGVAHDRLYRPLPPWVPNRLLCLQRGMTVGHAVVDGKGTPYCVVKLANAQQTAVLLCCCAAVLLCCCAAVLLCCCAAVLLCCCALLLLCCCAAVLCCCCAAVLLCCCATVLLCYCDQPHT